VELLMKFFAGINIATILQGIEEIEEEVGGGNKEKETQ